MKTTAAFFENKDNQPIVIVADGMGGHRAGDVASEMAVRLLSDAWKETTALLTAEEIETWLRKTIQEVNKEIVLYAESEMDLNGMGTTLVAAIMAQSQVVIANVGDSVVIYFKITFYVN